MSKIYYQPIFKIKMFVKEEYMPEIKVKYQQFVLSIKSSSGDLAICPSHTTHRAVHAVGGSERSQSIKPIS